MKAEFTLKILQWNRDQNDRKMPWKGEKDPYRIWLSEVILQQTRVEQGWAYYEKFVSEFPAVQHLASAADEKIFKMWEGLGYYSRCKNLIAAARKIVNEFGGVFPASYEQIRELPGIGPYTAAAISSFAFNEPYAVLDGNVQRVIARYFGISTPVDTATGRNLYQQLAQSLLDEDAPGIYNQAIMDFGAVICKPQRPLCHGCMQQADCEAYKHGLVDMLPVKEKKLRIKERWFYYFVIEVEGSIFIRKRTGKDIWENLYELVLYDSGPGPDDLQHYHGFLKELFRETPFTVNAVSKVFRQQLTHQTIRGQFITVSASEAPQDLKNYMLIEKKRLDEYAFPRFINDFFDDNSSQSELF